MTEVRSHAASRAAGEAAQRYRTAEDLVTASVAVSTVLALVTLTLVMMCVQWLP